MRLRRALARLTLAVAAVVGAACAGPPAVPPAGGAPGELVVFAAASLAEPFAELGPRFAAANGGARVSFNFAGTPQLRTQLEQGARADVFASANRDQMDAARASGVVVGETPVFAQNRLVAILPQENPGKIERLEDLARPGLRLVTAQAGVPVGQYTQDVLARMSRDPRFGADFQRRVSANVVSQEADVKQVVAKVRLGEADAAIVYATDVSPRAAVALGTLAIPDPLNIVADYPIGVVRGSARPDLAAAFVAYVVSGPGRDVLATYGFVVPNRAALGRPIRRV